jgi:tetratricopeptide (TPR) repeat protein
LTWFVAAALVVALSTFIFVLRTPASSPYPVAEAGESLIIVSRFAATDGLLARRDSLSDRVQTAIEREIDGRHIDHTRAITWTDDIADANTALFFAQRAGASAVLWGTRADDQWSVGLVTSRPRVHSYARGLGALIAEPLTPTFSLDPNAVEDIQALALFTLAQLDAQQEEYGSAHAALTQALAASPAATSTRALLLLYSGYWAQVARSPDLVSITESYSQALALDPDLLEAYLDRALVYVRANEPVGWESDLMHVLSVHSDHSGARLALCWAYALDRKPELAMPHCDAAVAHDATARSREGRAVAAAEAGRLEAAAADMRAFLDWLSKQPEPLRTRYGNTRAGWLQALQAGQNPFTDVVLSQLRVE